MSKAGAIRLLLLVLTGFFFAGRARAVPESTLATSFVTEIEPFYTHRANGTFIGERGAKIAFRFFPRPLGKGTIVIASGFSENMHKYAELAFDLYNQGYAVMLFDHRGQGFSDRLLPDKRKAHIDRYEFLVRDLHALFQHEVEPRTTGPRYLLAHSFGALVAARYLEEHPADFQAAVLTSPLLEPQLGRITPRLARIALNVLDFVNFDRFFVLGPRNPLAFRFADNQVTHSALRFDLLDKALASHEPQGQVWGLTARWLSEVLRLSDATFGESEKIRIPVTILQSDPDAFVLPAAETRFCGQLARCELLKVPNARHEILMESDSTRDFALRTILRVFQSR